MQQASTQLEFHTPGRGLTEVTHEIADWLTSTNLTTGLLTLLCRHTSASLLITENASPAVWGDMQRWLEKLAPEHDRYQHDTEGPDDMPAHLKAALTGVTLSIPVAGGRLALGTWQGIFLAEHRTRPHRRTIAVHLLGE